MDNQQFGIEIKKIRNEKKMSLRQVEIASGGLTSSFLSKLENGKRNIPKPATLKKLAKGLRISEAEMFKLAGIETNNTENKTINLDDLSSIMMFEGQPIPEEDKETVINVLRNLRKAREEINRKKNDK